MRQRTTTRGARRSRDLSIGRLVRGQWKPLSLALVAILGETLSDVLEPWPVKVVIDNLLQHKGLPSWLAAVAQWLGPGDLAVLNFAVVAVAVIAAAGAVSSYFEKSLTTSVSQWVTHDLRTTLYDHIQHLPLADHDHARKGDLITRVTSDIDAIQSFVGSALLGMLVDALTLVGMIGIMFWVNWRFTLVALGVTPVLFPVVYVFTRRIKQASRAVRQKDSELASVVEETLGGIRLVKTFAREDYESKRFASRSLDSVNTALKARSIKATLAPLVDIIVAAGSCLVLAYGARLALQGGISAGVLVVFLLYLGKMYKPMRGLSKGTDTVSKAVVGYERIRELVDAGERGQAADLAGARRAPRLRGDIEFDHVTFGYEGERETLRDVSFRIEAGQVAALVGASGAGKTTIAGLIARLYDPWSGTIKVDGTDIGRFTAKSLRDQIGFVLQETFLFRGPVWENISYGQPGASRQAVIRAARLAAAHEFIRRMPQGYDTIVGERGVTLSAGQRQRIAIARAIIRDAPILILDEPTTGLDAESEAAVAGALDRLMKGRTAIVIAHHLYTVRGADVILVIDDGEVAETGTHATLLARGGVYAHLYRTQEAEGRVAGRRARA